MLNKSRGLSSPDLADALSMTFSVRVAPSFHVTVSTVQHGSRRGKSAMAAMKVEKDVKVLLDSDGQAAADAAPSILESRSGTCSQHGDYIDQKIPIRSYVGLKPIAMPCWLGCPECRREAELANQLEAKRWVNLIPGEPSWTLRRR